MAEPTTGTPCEARKGAAAKATAEMATTANTWSSSTSFWAPVSTLVNEVAESTRTYLIVYPSDAASPMPALIPLGTDFSVLDANPVMSVSTPMVMVCVPADAAAPDGVVMTQPTARSDTAMAAAPKGMRL